MFRKLQTYQIVLDIVGAFVGLLVTLGLDLLLSAGTTGTTGGWITDDAMRIEHHVVVALVLWSAAAIARLSPPLALGVAWAGAVLQMIGGMWPGLVDVAVFTVLFAAGAWGSRKVLWLGGASALAGGILAGFYIVLVQGNGFTPDSEGQVQALVLGGLFGTAVLMSLALSWGAGLLRRVVLRGRATALAQVQAETLAAEEQERVRIARDMHDIVAHSLAVVIAQSDGARYAAATQPELAQEALGTIAQTARGALSDVRMLLTQLRHRQGEGPQPTLADLETLFAHVRQAGAEPRVTIDPMPPGEPPGAIQLAVYRILQEALTNALRHGDGDIDVRIAWWLDRVDLEVTNSVTDQRSGVGGHGLIGMRERAQLVGGTLQAEGDAARFVVRASLPIGPSAVLSAEPWIPEEK